MEQGHGPDKGDFCHTGAGSHSNQSSTDVLITSDEGSAKPFRARGLLVFVAVIFLIFFFTLSFVTQSEIFRLQYFMVILSISLLNVKKKKKYSSTS